MHFERILVPIDGSLSDAEAMELACSLAGEDGTVYAVHVISVGRALPLDAEVETEISKAEKLLADVEAIASTNDSNIETDLLQARDVGPAIIDEAVERGIDLILIGSSYKTHFGEFCLGDIIPYVLRNAPCRVIVDQQRNV